jgi:hypothetical protein
MVTEICLPAGGQQIMSGEIDSMTYEARIRYWEEEWLSQLLEEALRLKGDKPEKPPRKTRAKCA